MDYVNAFKSFSLGKKNNNDLFVDRLNHRYTVTLFLIFGMIFIYSQYGGRPICCWLAKYFLNKKATSLKYH